MLNNKPNFLVVGAAKSGTTSLYGYLKQHPDVFIPERKECRYYSSIDKKIINPFTDKELTIQITKKEEYYKLFQNVDKKALGDVSPDYLFYYKESVKNIVNELGKNVKIIILLRNPVDRAYSNYLHLLREGLIPSDINITEVLAKEEKWAKKNVWWGYLISKPGYYYNSVKYYLETFSNVKIILFEEFINSPKENLVDICNYLNIDRNFKFLEPTFKNKTGIPRFKFIEYNSRNDTILKKILNKFIITLIGEEKKKFILTRIKEYNLIKPEIKEYIRKKLLKKYYHDIINLEKLINKDLSLWKKGNIK